MSITANNIINEQALETSAEQAQSKNCAWWHLPVETILVVAVAIVFLELFFRLCGVGGQEFLEPDPILGCRQIPNKHVIWRFEGFSDGTLNSNGRRDVEHTLAKPNGVTRIAVLGDSATEGLQVPLKDTYCRVLEEQLNKKQRVDAIHPYKTYLRGMALPCPNQKYEVLNFGCSSYSTGQQILQFEKEVLPYHPDITVLLYVRGAALQNVYNPYKKIAEPKPYFYLDNEEQLHQDNSILKEQAATLRPNAIMNFLRKNSRIYGVFSQANLSLSIHEPLYNKIKGWVFKLTSCFQNPTILSQQRQVEAGGTPAFPDKAFPSKTSALPNKVPPGRILYPPQDAWLVTKPLLDRLNNDCKLNHSKLIVMIFPNTINDPILAKQIPDLEQLGTKEGFDVLDLTQAFKANPDPNSLFLQYHFSSAGHQLVADQLASFLHRGGNDFPSPLH